MKLPETLHQDIIVFLKSLPIFHDAESQRAFVYHVGLDPQLHTQIPFGKACAQFVPFLVSTLLQYGSLATKRNPLESVLITAKDYIGEDRQLYCDTLLKELQFLNRILDRRQMGEYVESIDIEKEVRELCEVFSLINQMGEPGRQALGFDTIKIGCLCGLCEGEVSSNQLQVIFGVFGILLQDKSTFDVVFHQWNPAGKDTLEKTLNQMRQKIIEQERSVIFCLIWFNVFSSVSFPAGFH